MTLTGLLDPASNTFYPPQFSPLFITNRTYDQLFFDGFETYVAGSVDGQGGWFDSTISGVSGGSRNVSLAAPLTGLKSLDISTDGGANFSYSAKAIPTGLFVSDSYRVTWRIQATGTTYINMFLGETNDQLTTPFVWYFGVDGLGGCVYQDSVNPPVIFPAGSVIAGVVHDIEVITSVAGATVTINIDGLAFTVQALVAPAPLNFIHFGCNAAPAGSQGLIDDPCVSILNPGRKAVTILYDGEETEAFSMLGTGKVSIQGVGDLFTDGAQTLILSICDEATPVKFLDVPLSTVAGQAGGSNMIDNMMVNPRWGKIRCANPLDTLKVHGVNVSMVQN